MAASRFVPHSALPTVKDWNFDFGTFEDVANELIDLTLKDVFKDSSCSPNVGLPFAWSRGDGIGGPKPANPLTIYVSIDAFEGGNMGNGITGMPYYEVTLSEMIDEAIDLHSCIDGAICDDGTLAGIRDELLTLAARISLAIAS